MAGILPLSQAPDDDTSPPPQPVQLTLTVSDPEVVRELECREEEARERFALTALRIGVLAVRQAQGQTDVEALRQESDRLLDGLRHRLGDHAQHVQSQLTSLLKEYFDPQSGRFQDRVQRLIRKDGELETLIRRQVDSEDSQLARTLAAHVGAKSELMKRLDPDQSKGILSSMNEMLDEQLRQQREHVVGQFSLDDEQSALSRLVRELSNHQGKLTERLQKQISDVVREFSLDEEDSALSRLVRNVDRAQRTITSEFSLDDEDSALARLKREMTGLLKEQQESHRRFQEEVKVALKGLSARKQEARRSTRHGLEFEDAVCQFIQFEAQQAGDIASRTGNQTGRVKHCKVGDCVIELGPESAAAESRIVIEAKEQAGYQLKQALEELDLGRKNRAAEIGVFVCSRRTAPPEMESLARFGSNIVVVWDPEDSSTDLFLRVGLTLARALCCRREPVSDAPSIDFDALDEAVLDIEKKAESLAEIEKSTESIRNHTDKIQKRAQVARRTLLRHASELQSQLQRLQRMGTEAGEA